MKNLAAPLLLSLTLAFATSAQAKESLNPNTKVKQCAIEAMQETEIDNARVVKSEDGNKVELFNPKPKLSENSVSPDFIPGLLSDEELALVDEEVRKNIPNRLRQSHGAGIGYEYNPADDSVNFYSYHDGQPNALADNEIASLKFDTFKKGSDTFEYTGKFFKREDVLSTLREVDDHEWNGFAGGTKVVDKVVDKLGEAFMGCMKDQAKPQTPLYLSGIKLPNYNRS